MDTSQNKTTFDRLNPVTGAVASTTPAATVADANAAVEAAASAFVEWSLLGPNARRGLLNKAADALVANSDDFVAAMTEEIGARSSRQKSARCWSAIHAKARRRWARSSTGRRSTMSVA